MLTMEGTYIVPSTRAGASWSKESIIALATIFIMISISALGFIMKHRLRTFISLRLGQRESCMAARGTHAKHCRIHPRLMALIDIELLPMSRVMTASDWVDMANVRRYQQETYTWQVRLRRGPRTTRLVGAARL
jgi:hypothetical protein